jgi:hypothetical protein
MRTVEKLTRHQVLLYPGDFERLSRMTRGGGAGTIIRELVRRYLIATDQMMEKELEDGRRTDAR